MQLSEDEAYSSVRFSFGVLNTAAEIDITVAVLAGICKRLRTFASHIHNPYHVTKA